MQLAPQNKTMGRSVPGGGLGGGGGLEVGVGGGWREVGVRIGGGGLSQS